MDELKDKAFPNAKPTINIPIRDGYSIEIEAIYCIDEEYGDIYGQLLFWDIRLMHEDKNVESTAVYVDANYI